MFDDVRGLLSGKTLTEVIDQPTSPD